jgi:hypothetical protein
LDSPSTFSFEGGDLVGGDEADLAHADAVVAVVLAEELPAAKLVGCQARDPQPALEGRADARNRRADVPGLGPRRNAMSDQIEVLR